MFNHQCPTHVKTTLGSSNVCTGLVILNGKLHWSSSFAWDNFGLPIPNSNLGRAAWAPRSGLFGGSAAVAWRHHVTWHRWYMRGLKVSVALYEIDIVLMVILILFLFYWWPFLNNRQYRWLNEFSFEPERSLLICPMFWSISALVRAVQKVEGRLRDRWCRVSVGVLWCIKYVQQSPRLFWNPLWNTTMHIYASLCQHVSECIIVS